MPRANRPSGSVLTAAHKKYHDNEDVAKIYQEKYWEWHETEEIESGNQDDLTSLEKFRDEEKTCSCDRLNPVQHREGCRLAKEWFYKAQW
jgi:hypothetical protein